jgi:hypothetical protein
MLADRIIAGTSGQYAHAFLFNLFANSRLVQNTVRSSPLTVVRENIMLNARVEKRMARWL